MVNEANVSEVLQQIADEVEKASSKFPTWPDDIIHAGNVVAEEAGELAKAILQSVYEPHKASIDDVREEAIQTGAMAVRFLMSLHRYDLRHSTQHSQSAA